MYSKTMKCVYSSTYFRATLSQTVYDKVNFGIKLSEAELYN